MADFGRTHSDVQTQLRMDGFEGFVEVSALQQNRKSIPKIRGVYVVLRPDLTAPDFLEIGTGGHFKGRNPNVSIDILRNRWLPNEHIVYIGKAGGSRYKSTLYSRLGQLLSYGRGVAVGHEGGCYLWQLANAGDLVICWKTVASEEPESVESQMIDHFKTRTGSWPFANRKG